MKDYFEILGTQIKYDEIKKYRLIEKEFIFRPVFDEEVFYYNNNKSKSQYLFREMSPYAAIIGEVGKKASLGDYNTKAFIDIPGKEFIQGTIEVIGDKIKPMVFGETKYICMNTAGRRFNLYLDDVPALVIKEDGQVLDIYQSDALYEELGGKVAPAIHIVLALYIKAKEEYLFFGNGIQVDDIGIAYEALKNEMESYNEEKKAIKEEKRFRLPKAKIPVIKIPELKKREIGLKKDKNHSSSED